MGLASGRLRAAALGVIGLLWAVSAAAQDGPTTITVEQFVRGDQATAPEKTHALIAQRNALVKSVRWNQDELDIAATQQSMEQTKEALAVTRAKLQESTDKLAQLQALLTPTLKADNPELYAKTEAMVPDVTAAIAKAQAEVAMYQGRVDASGNQIAQYMAANPPSEQKHTATSDAATYKHLGARVQCLYKQAHFIIDKYGYESNADKASIDAADVANLMMKPDGTWPNQLAADAFVGSDTALLYLRKVWTAQKAAGFSEVDVEVAKKMLVTALIFATRYQARLAGDAAVQAEITTRATEMGERIIAQNRVTIQDLNDMQDLLIETIGKRQ